MVTFDAMKHSLAFNFGIGSFSFNVGDLLKAFEFFTSPTSYLLSDLKLMQTFSLQRALFDALEIPLIGGTTESRHLCMDKLKTRNTLLADQSVPCAEGFVHHKGICFSVCEKYQISYPDLVLSCTVKVGLGKRKTCFKANESLT